MLILACETERSPAANALFKFAAGALFSNNWRLQFIDHARYNWAKEYFVATPPAEQ